MPVTVWLLPESDGRDTGAARPTEVTVPEQSAKSKPATKDSDSRPPDHIVNDRVSQDRWTLSEDPQQASQGMGSCDLSSIVDSSPPTGLQSSVSHTTGSDTALLQMRPKDAGEGKRPAPYYISVGVRPPHETDRATGRPLRSVSKGIGFTSKPVDLYSRWTSGGTVKLKYPDDFRAHFGKRTVDAIPVGDDRGTGPWCCTTSRAGRRSTHPSCATGFTPETQTRGVPRPGGRAPGGPRSCERSAGLPSALAEVIPQRAGHLRHQRVGAGLRTGRDE